MFLREGTPGALCLGVCLTIACSHRSWPDEPGIPVELVRAENVDAADTFLSTLTSRRRAEQRTPPIVAPGYETEMRGFAEDLQAGKTSAGGTEGAVAAWARSVYHREVKSFVLDCSAGSAMPLPAFLVEAPTLVIACAAAHFRPRSLPHRQCAVIAVVPVGSERVEAPKL